MDMKEVNRGNPPVKEGEKYFLTCEGKGSKGDGVMKVEDFVIFCPDAEVGAKYEVEITNVLPKVGFAQIIKEVTE